MILECAVITGASSGIGLEFSKELAKRGYNLILVARRKEILKNIKKELETKKTKVIICDADLSNESGIEKVEKEIQKHNVTFLVNAAGFGSANYFTDTDEQLLKSMVNVHILATTSLCKKALENMIKINKGTIINLSSIASYIRNPKSNALYNSTKKDIKHFSIVLQKELRNKNKSIKIQALTPGLVETNFHNIRGKNNYLKAPWFMWMTTKKVVDYSLKSLKRRKVVCIPGLLNKISMCFLRLF